MNPTSLPHGAAPAADPLAALRGIHTPDPIGLWPLAPGWWGLVAVVVMATIATAVIVKRRRASLARRASRELDAIARRGLDLQGLATQVSELLRRVALVRFGHVAASLHGRSWQDFLSEHAPRSRRGRTVAGALAGDVGHLIALAPYAPPSFADQEAARIGCDQLVAAARAWIRGNR